MARHEILSEVTGTVWQIEVAVGDSVSSGDDVLILESMKMEIPALAPCDGIIVELTVASGQTVEEGQLLAIVED
ncbi:MAG: biotin/lipoyl-binding carrier protein [Nitriliruptoraceae bacterium]